MPGFAVRSRRASRSESSVGDGDVVLEGDRQLVDTLALHKAVASDLGVDLPSNDADSKSSSFVGTVVLAVLAAWVGLISVRPWGDNSALTHLATGRRLLDGDFLTTDPYTFTSLGRPFTVQSWLPSIGMALSERIHPQYGPQVWKGLLVLLVAGIGAALVASASGVLARAVPFALLLVAGTGMWGERPYMLGLAAIGVLLLSLDGRVHANWLVPVGWLWVNSHGSFALAPLLLGAFVVGERLDRGSWRATSWRVAVAMHVGIAIGVANPFGPRLLTFPLVVGRQREALRTIVEWQAPRYTSAAELAVLGLALLAVVALVRQPSWRWTSLLCLSTALAMTGQRNLNVLALVALPIVAQGLNGIGSLTVSRRRVIPLGIAAAFGVAIGSPTSGFGAVGYPAGGVAEVLDEAPTNRVATPDFVGNFLTSALNGDRLVFVDDRADMMAIETVRDYRTLMRGEAAWSEILDRYDVDRVLWQVDSALASLIAADGGWRTTWSDGVWFVAERVAP
jgi:hypothetical protein